MTKRLFIWVVLCLSWSTSLATHVVGGSLGYAFLGIDGSSGLFRYKIILTTYTDCSSFSEIPVPETSLSIGVYFHDALNANASKQLKQTYNIPLASSERITPPLPPGCSIGQGTCINKAIYELEILLETSSDGYHIYYERCCRNTALVNIVGPVQTSTGFHAFIPPTSIPNSSPLFLDDPIPLLCIGDSLWLLETAVDPDGDFLLYSFTAPYAGFADMFNPAPIPGSILQWPIPPVVHQGAFSTNLPLGPGSYTYLNALTGLAVYKAALSGNFAVAVQVSEYRNNVLISSTRREMQFIALPCPTNQTPVGQFTSGLNIQAVEGDSLCFEFEYNDPDADSVFLEVSGEPFMQLSPAIYSHTYNASHSIKGKICWVPSCGSARTLPYSIAYKAYDNGCIPKTRVNIVQITVVPDTAKMQVWGDTAICGLQTSIYQTNKTEGTFLWTISGGDISPPSHSSSASVTWSLSPPQQGTVSVVRQGLCTNDTANITVNIKSPEYAGFMADVWLCPGSSQQLEAEPGGTHYSWIPGIWLSDSVIYNPVTNTPDSLIYSVTYRDSMGCEKFDSLLVLVNNKVPVDAGTDVAVCRGTENILLGGSPTGPSNAAFHWLPNIGLSDSSSSNPVIYIPENGQYYVTATVDTCHASDTVTVTIFELPLVYAGNDTMVCDGAEFSLNGMALGNVVWHPDGGLLSSLNTLTPRFYAESGIYFPVLLATSEDGCIASDTVRLEIAPLPDLYVKDTLICRGDSALLNISGAETYVWQSSAYLSHLSGSFTNVYTESSVHVIIQGTDTNGCTSQDSIRVEIYRGVLQIEDSSLCIGKSVTLSFTAEEYTSVTWTPPTYLSSPTGENVIATPTQDIVYTAHITNQIGCIDSAEISLSVNPLPVLGSSYQSTLFCKHTEFNFSSNNPADSVIWIYKNTGIGYGLEVSLSVPHHDTATTVFMVGYTDQGCTDTLVITPNLPQLEDLLLAILPNIITPNKDGINDSWTLALPDGFSECFRMTIYNRWGAEVFMAETLPVKWEGLSNAEKELTEGVYFYVMEVGKVSKNGTITLVR